MKIDREDDLELVMKNEKHSYPSTFRATVTIVYGERDAANRQLP